MNKVKEFIEKHEYAIKNEVAMASKYLVGFILGYYACKQVHILYLNRK